MRVWGMPVVLLEHFKRPGADCFHGLGVFVSDRGVELPIFRDLELLKLKRPLLLLLRLVLCRLLLVGTD